jgi:divalent metal cation (Fe/Co/Zn/Cd) transporter
MDGCLCSDRFEAIITLADKIKGIKKIHNLKFRQTGRDVIVEAVVQLEGDIPVSEAYEIVNTLKQSIMTDDPEVGRVTIELEPAKSP